MEKAGVRQALPRHRWYQHKIQALGFGHVRADRYGMNLHTASKQQLYEV